MCRAPPSPALAQQPACRGHHATVVGVGGEASRSVSLPSSISLPQGSLGALDHPWDEGLSRITMVPPKADVGFCSPPFQRVGCSGFSCVCLRGSKREARSQSLSLHVSCSLAVAVVAVDVVSKESHQRPHLLIFAPKGADPPEAQCCLVLPTPFLVQSAAFPARSGAVEVSSVGSITRVLACWE